TPADRVRTGGRYDCEHRRRVHRSRRRRSANGSFRVRPAGYTGRMGSPAAAVLVARPGRLYAFMERNWRLFAELLFIVPAYVAYQFVRGAVHGKAGTAFDNAAALIRTEQRIG